MRGVNIMKIDYQKIQQAIAEETHAGGFAELMQKFKKIGVLKYDYFVADGFYRYYDCDSFVDLKMNGIPKTVVPISDKTKIKQAVKNAQAGAFDFETFCMLAGEAGILYWCTDLLKKTVTYIDCSNQIVLEEPIPAL